MSGRTTIPAEKLRCQTLSAIEAPSDGTIRNDESLDFDLSSGARGASIACAWGGTELFGEGEAGEGGPFCPGGMSRLVCDGLGLPDGVRGAAYGRRCCCC